MIGSTLKAKHDVDPDQFEPGIPEGEQARQHALSIGMLEWDFDAQIGVHRRFAFEVFVPVRTTIIDASFEGGGGEPLPNFESIHHRDETIAGVGDVTLGGRTGLVLPTDVPRWTFALRTAVSLPTGDIKPDPFKLGADGHEHQHMFFGSGTVDPIIGFDTNIALNKWGLTAWSMARLPLYANQHGYQGSKVVVGGIGAQSGFGLKRFVFLLQPEAYFETPAVWSGEPARNSGRTNLLATGGVFVRLPKGWQVHGLLKVPFFTRAQGGQLRWPFVGIVGFSYTFNTIRDAHDH